MIAEKNITALNYLHNNDLHHGRLNLGSIVIDGDEVQLNNASLFVEFGYDNHSAYIQDLKDLWSTILCIYLKCRENDLVPNLEKSEAKDLLSSDV